MNGFLQKVYFGLIGLFQTIKALAYHYMASGASLAHIASVLDFYAIF